MMPGSKGILPPDAGGLQSRPAAYRHCMTSSFDSQWSETEKTRHTEGKRVRKIKIIIFYMFSKKITG